MFRWKVLSRVQPVTTGTRVESYLLVLFVGPLHYVDMISTLVSAHPSDPPYRPSSLFFPVYSPRNYLPILKSLIPSSFTVQSPYWTRFYVSIRTPDYTLTSRPFLTHLSSGSVDPSLK